MPKLIVQVGNDVKEYHAEGEMVMGRDATNPIPILDGQASRKHARFVASPDGTFFVEDLKSANGTLVNGSKITKQPLKPGDIIEIGACKIIFSADDIARNRAEMEQDGFMMTGIAAQSASKVAPPVNKPIDLPAAAAVNAAAAEAKKPERVAGTPMLESRVAPPVASLPKRKVKGKQKSALVPILVVLVILIGGGLYLSTQLNKEKVIPAVPLEEFKAKLKASDYQGVVALADQYEKTEKSASDAAEIKKFKSQAKGELKAIEIQKLIFEKADFNEAEAAAQAAMNDYVELSDRFVKLSTLANAAESVVDIGNLQKEMDQAYEPAAIDAAIKSLTTLIEKYKANQTDLDKVKSVKDAFEKATPLLDKMKARKKDSEMALKAWNDAKAARAVTNWTKEIDALKAMNKAAPDVVAKVAGAQGSYLLDNAVSFNGALDATTAEKFDESVALYEKIDAQDFHYGLAQKLLVDARENAKIQKAESFYKQGKVSDALAALKSATSTKAKELGQKIDRVSKAFADLLVLEQGKAWGDTVTAATELLSTLQKDKDGYFYLQTSDKLRAARLEVLTAQFGDLTDAYAQKRWNGLAGKVVAFTYSVDKELYPELYAKAKDFQDKLIKEVTERGSERLAESKDIFAAYQKNPIKKEERAADKGQSDTYSAKAAQLKSAYTKANEALGWQYGLAETPEKMELTQVHDKIRTEILAQNERLFASVRFAYVEMGNFEGVRLTEDKILQMPELSDDRWYQAVKSIREEKKKRAMRTQVQ